MYGYIGDLEMLTHNYGPGAPTSDAAQGSDVYCSQLCGIITVCNRVHV